MAISKIVYKSSASATPVVWMDATSCTATAADITAPKTAMLADGVVTTGTGSGGGGTTWQTIYDGSMNLNLTDDGTYYYQFFEFHDYIAQNSVWRITWNNTQYSCTATSAGITGDEFAIPYALGNGSIIGISGGNNEPFFMQKYYRVGEKIVVFATSSGTKTVKIEKQVTY